MGRIVNTNDLFNRMQVYPGLGVFREKILAIFSWVVRDCPTATDDKAVSETIDRVLEIIDRLNDTKALVDKTPLGHHIHKTLANEIKQEVLALKGGEG